MQMIKVLDGGKERQGGVKSSISWERLVKEYLNDECSANEKIVQLEIGEFAITMVFEQI